MCFAYDNCCGSIRKSSKIQLAHKAEYSFQIQFSKKRFCSFILELCVFDCWTIYTFTSNDLVRQYFGRVRVLVQL